MSEQLINVYKDSKVFSKMMEKIQETKDQYCINPQGVVMIKSGGSKVIEKTSDFRDNFRQTSGWVTYLDMAKRDSRLNDDLITDKVIETLTEGDK